MQKEQLIGENDKELIFYSKDIPSNIFYFAESTKARVLLEKIADSARKYEESEISVELQKKKKTYLISSLLYR